MSNKYLIYKRAKLSKKKRRNKQTFEAAFSNKKDSTNSGMIGGGASDRIRTISLGILGVKSLELKKN